MDMEDMTQYSPGFIGPQLDIMARYDAWNRKRAAFAEIAAEELLAGRPDSALMWATRYRDLDARMRACVKRELTDTH